ncbi:MAG: lactonase family protein, partial [Dysgonamonadaceae bacterium]|nr:lactonase family protein [Dysgonamonadaceae bacterium]
MKSKLFCLLICACTLFACSNKSPKQAGNSKLFLLVGTYTSGSSDGIYVYELDTITGETSYVSETKVSNPSFLAVSEDEKYVYAVSEDKGD